MTTLAAPPLDLAPRLASGSLSDFPIPHGREEAWRFTPLDKVKHMLDVDPDAGDVTSEASGFVTVGPIDAADAGHWLPTDRASVVAWVSAGTSVRVDIPADTVVEEPVIVHLKAQAARAHAHVDVRLGRHAKATVVLVHDAEADVSGNIVTQVGDGGDLTMLSILDESADADASGVMSERVQLWHWPVQIGRDATFLGSAITLAGSVVRMLPSVTFAGPGGSATLLGAFLASEGQYLEHRILVEHEAPHCTSSVTYKGALSGEGTHTVWVGDVVVRRDAIGTETYEMNRNLLLDDGARADSVPNLELETGDIASAGHASATGRFDDQQLFYLQARGIPERVARQLVVRGFFVDVLTRVGSRQWRDAVLDRIAQRLGMEPELERELKADS
ncbi:MAG: SufD family Fe-S cluster assembly protein [Candidatus Nanopelagicales bacterium]